MTHNAPDNEQARTLISRIFTTAGDIEGKLKEVANLVSAAIDADWIAIVITNRIRGGISHSILSGAGSSSQKPLDSYEVLTFFQTKPLVYPEEDDLTSASKGFDQLFSRRFLESTTQYRGLVEKLVIGGQILGIICAARQSQAAPFSEQSLRLLKETGLQVSLAILNEQLLRQEKKQRDQATTLREVARILTSSLDLFTLLDLILDQMERVVAYDSATIMLLEGQTLRIAAHRKLRSLEQLNVEGEASQYPHITEVLHNRAPVIINDTENDPQWKKVPGISYIQSWLGAPLIGKTEVIGLLNLDKEQKYFYTDEDAELARAFANQAAVAIENARLYQAAREAADRSAALHQISQQIVSAGMDKEGIYSAVYEAAGQLMPAEAFAITWYDPNNPDVHDAFLMDQDSRIDSQDSSLKMGLSGKVIRTGKTIYIPDLTQDPDRESFVHFGSPKSVRSVLATPMRLRGKVHGMISVQSYQPFTYTKEDQTLLEMLAAYAAIAIDNAQLFAHIQRLATIDPVTGISNRRHFFDRGQHEFLRADRFHRPLSIIMMDIDHFKSVNDNYGHAAGDETLVRLCKLLRTEIREIDLVGRYGGEEFTILLPETGQEAGVEVAERLRHKINLTFHADNQNLPIITVSIGVADNRHPAANIVELVAYADKALYAAKAAGRDCVKAYSPRI